MINLIFELGVFRLRVRHPSIVGNRLNMSSVSVGRIGIASLTVDASVLPIVLESSPDHLSNRRASMKR